jgi:hypothetical protein
MFLNTMPFSEIARAVATKQHWFIIYIIEREGTEIVDRL